MNLRKSVTALAAVSLVAAPAVIQAAQAQTSVSRLSVRSAPAVRTGSRVSKASKIDGGTLAVAIVAVGVVGIGVAAAASGNNTPASPN